MDISELERLLSAAVILDCGHETGHGYDAVCGCDMMSELLAIMNQNGQNSRGVVLLTNLINPQVVRTSEMVDIKLVVLLRGKRPTPETVKLAESCGISIMTTPYTMFSSCGILYNRGLKDIQPHENRV